MRSPRKPAEARQAPAAAGEGALPPLPAVDGKWLFWEMIRVSRTLDPWMYPALKKLKASGHFLLGALSNTIILPADHPYRTGAYDDLQSQFDVLISSAHVGMRKPEREIYELALKRLDQHASSFHRPGERASGAASGLKADDIVFLDDIGENLKMARLLGMRTIKVNLDRAKDAVEELESLTGMSLLTDDRRRERL